MGYYKYVQQLWKRPKDNLGELYRQRLIQWRREPSIVKLERPTRIDRARSLGWKPLPGMVVVRVKIRRGSRKREKFAGGRRTKSYYFYRYLDIPLQVIAEQRAARKFPNMEVLGSYWVGEDGQYKWFEVILVDPYNPNIYSRPEYSWLLLKANRKRVFRGLTPRAKKARRLKEHWK